jgi:hypothetical protein
MEIQQKSNNKICLIGYGYWGKILHKNLVSLGYNEIKIIDIVLDNYHEITDEYSHYFIITPFLSHFQDLKKISEFKNKKIWCEKPLVQTVDEAKIIYNLMETNNNKLFIDWVYTFNPCIKNIKKIIKNKKIKQVILNRTNDGPKRNDCTSIFDLSVHDLSILYYLFEFDYIDMTWNEFSVKSNENFGSNVSWYYNDGLQVIINSSWQHRDKNRVSLFITEDDEIANNSPYGFSKYLAEEAVKASKLNYVIFRFFNLTGADPEGEFGEAHEPETHLIPKLILDMDHIEVNGTDYATKDGTCVRDYVHVTDIADAHLNAVEYLAKGGKSDTFNLGTGQGHTILEIIKELELVANKKIKYKSTPRREGDATSLIADTKKATIILKYTPKYDITSILNTAYEWHNHG